MDARTSYLRSTPLQAAIIQCHVATIGSLIALGADPNTADAQGNSPLHYTAHAWTANKVNVVKLLLNSGGDVKKKNKMGFIPLHHALNSSDDVELVRELTKYGTNMKRGEWGGSTLRGAMALAALTGDDESVRLLMTGDRMLRRTSTLNSLACGGTMPLHWAVWQGHLVTVQILLRFGAAVDDDNGSGTPLSWAVERNNTAIISALLKEGANPNKAALSAIKAGLYDPALIKESGLEIVAYNQVRMVQQMVKEKKWKHFDDEVLTVAVQWASIEMVDLLVKIGVKLVPKLIHAAALWAGVDMIRKLVEFGLDVNALYQGESALHWVTRRRILEIGQQLGHLKRQGARSIIEGETKAVIRELVRLGAKIDCTTPKGETPLHFAVKHGCVDAVQELIALGARKDARAIGGLTPLHSLSLYVVPAQLQPFFTEPYHNAKWIMGKPFFYAILRELRAVMRELVHHGVDINETTDSGDSIIHLFVILDDSRFMQLIMEAKEMGASINARNELGETPLHTLFLMCSGIAEVFLYKLNLLVRAGANLEDHVAEGSTISHIALWSLAKWEQYMLRTRAHATIEQMSKYTPSFIKPERWGIRGYNVLRLGVLERLYHMGVNFNAKGNEGETPIFRAVEIVEREDLMIQKLSFRGADVNEKRGDGSTPLHHVLEYYKHDERKKLNLVEVLVGLGANVSEKRTNGETPFAMALSTVDDGIRVAILSCLQTSESTRRVSSSTDVSDSPGHSSFPAEKRRKKDG